MEPTLLICNTLDFYTEAIVDGLIAHLPDSERERIGKEKLFSRRREKMIAYKLLWDHLHDTGLQPEMPQISYTPEGQPLLKSHPSLHISITHCKTAVAVALYNQPIGIDAESIRPYNKNLAERVFSPEEIAEIESADNPDSLFSKLWTRKEAYVKYLGTGIKGFDQLRSIPVSSPESAALISTQELPDHRGWISLCCPRSQQPPSTMLKAVKKALEKA